MSGVSQVALMVKNLTVSARDIGDSDSVPGSQEDPLEEATPVFLPGESHGEQSLVDYSPWGRKSQTQLKQPNTHVRPQ